MSLFFIFFFVFFFYKQNTAYVMRISDWSSYVCSSDLLIGLADEVGDEERFRLAVDLGRRADLLDDAVIHHHDAIGHRQRFLLVVGYHDGGNAELALQFLDLVAQVDAHLGVERRERLVEQQEPRRGGDGAGERDALLLAARELRRVLAALVGKADEVEQLADPRGNFRFGAATVLQPEGDVALDGEIREQGVGLEHDAEVELGDRQGRNVPPGLPRPEQRRDR